MCYCFLKNNNLYYEVKLMILFIIKKYRKRLYINIINLLLKISCHKDSIRVILEITKVF